MPQAIKINAINVSFSALVTRKCNKISEKQFSILMWVEITWIFYKYLAWPHHWEISSSLDSHCEASKGKIKISNFFKTNQLHRLATKLSSFRCWAYRFIEKVSRACKISLVIVSRSRKSSVCNDAKNWTLSSIWRKTKKIRMRILIVNLLRKFIWNRWQGLRFANLFVSSYRFTSHIKRHVTPRRSLCAVSSQRLLFIHSQRERLKLTVRYGVEFIRSVIIRHTQSRGH